MHATLVSNGTHRIQWAVGLAVDTTAHHGSSIRHHHTTYLGARTVDTVTWNCKLFSAPGRVKHFLVPSLQVHRNLRRNTKGRPCFSWHRGTAGHAHGHGASRLARSVRSRLCRVRRAGHETLGCAGAALQGKLPFLKKPGMAATAVRKPHVRCPNQTDNRYWMVRAHARLRCTCTDPTHGPGPTRHAHGHPHPPTRVESLSSTFDSRQDTCTRR